MEAVKQTRSLNIYVINTNFPYALYTLRDVLLLRKTS